MTSARPSICLCMIVRDEVDVLARCLRSCREHIDCWVICDTGSTDGTQDLVRRELAGIPGELHEHEWIDFGHNRTVMLRLARGRADYLLILDADTSIEVDDHALRGLDADAYLLRDEGEARYYTKRLVSGRLDWRYVGAVHEYIESAEERTAERLDGVRIRSWSTGAVRHGRWERDLELLAAAVEADPDDARARFYLAQTCRDLGRHTGDERLLRDALEHYERRAEMPGWIEEAYCASQQAGVVAEGLGDWPRAIDAFVRAWELRPQRLEAVHALASGLRARGLHHAAHRFASLAAGPGPLPVPGDILFVVPWIYEWGLLFEYSITSFWVGEYAQSVAACKRLLATPSLPEPHRLQTLENVKHALRETARLAADRPARHHRIAHAGTPTRGRAPE